MNFNHLIAHWLYTKRDKFNATNVAPYRCFFDTFSASLDFYAVAALVWRLFAGVKLVLRWTDDSWDSQRLNTMRDELVKSMFPLRTDFVKNVAGTWPFNVISGTQFLWNRLKGSLQPSLSLQFHEFMQRHSLYYTTHDIAWAAVKKFAFAGATEMHLDDKPNDAASRERLEFMLDRQGAAGSAEPSAAVSRTLFSTKPLLDEPVRGGARARGRGRPGRAIDGRSGGRSTGHITGRSTTGRSTTGRSTTGRSTTGRPRGRPRGRSSTRGRGTSRAGGRAGGRDTA
jgi:hypothetical protein